MPVVGSLYSSARRLIESLAGTKDSSTGFKRVVMIEHPRKGMWCIGFLTSIVEISNTQTMATVYIPTAPTPNSGFVVMVPYKEGEGDLSVVLLGNDGGGLESNVNRWRHQLNMGNISLEEIENNISTQTGKLGDYSLIKIVNEKTNGAFICAILPIQGQTLFVKLSIKANYLPNIEGDFIKFCPSLNLAI